MADRTGVVPAIRRWSVLLLVVTAGAGCSPMDDVIAGIFGRSMRSQPSLGAYEQEPLRPAEGSVPFASGNFPAAEGQVNVGQAEGVAVPPPITLGMIVGAMGQPASVPEITNLVNPVSPSPASLERGMEMYNRACVPCHGEAGDGQGPVNRMGIPPFSLVAPHVAAYSDGLLYSIIRIGRGLMPAYGHQLTHFDRWHVVNYLRQLQGQQGQQQPLQQPGGAESGASGQD